MLAPEHALVCCSLFPLPLPSAFLSIFASPTKTPSPLRSDFNLALAMNGQMPLPNPSVYQSTIHSSTQLPSIHVPVLRNICHIHTYVQCSMSSPLKTLRTGKGIILFAIKILVFYIAGHTIQGLTRIGC